MIFQSALGELPRHCWIQWHKKSHRLNRARILLVWLLKFFSQLIIRCWAYMSYLFHSGSPWSLWRKRQLPMGQFITAVSGMGWATFLRKIMISLSLTQNYCSALYELSCWQRGRAEGWQPKGGRSKTRRVVPRCGDGQRDLLHMWLHPGPIDRFVFPSNLKKSAPRWYNREGKQEVGQHHHKSGRKIIGLLHLL